MGRAQTFQLISAVMTCKKSVFIFGLLNTHGIDVHAYILYEIVAPIMHILRRCVYNYLLFCENSNTCSMPEHR